MVSFKNHNHSMNVICKENIYARMFRQNNFQKYEFSKQITNALSMDETEENVDILAVRKSFEKDPRKVIEIEMNKDGIFSERTIYAMENTLNMSLLSPPEGPKLANEAEALFVLSKNGHILETVESDFIEGYISPMVYRSSSMKFPQVPIAPKFVKMIKDMNAGSGVPHATITSTINNILDRFFSGYLLVSNRVKMGYGKVEE
jgi:hypothetical protein